MGNSTNFIERSLLYPQHGRQSLYHWYVGNRKNFIERSLLYPQQVGRSLSRIFGILYIQCVNHFFEKFNLLTNLKLDSKAKLLEFQSKTNIHQANGHQLTRLSKQEKAWQKTGTKNKWVVDGVVTELHCSVGGLASQTVQGISYDNWGYIQCFPLYS